LRPARAAAPAGSAGLVALLLLLLTATLVPLGGCGRGQRPGTGTPAASAPPPPPLLPGRTLAALDPTQDPGAAGAVELLPPPLRITELGPRGRTDTGEPTLFVRFNQPVVSLEQSGQELSTARFEITPPLPGRAYFQTPERLVFEPAQPLAKAQRYTVRLRGTITALSGAVWQGAGPGQAAGAASEPAADLAWELESERPQVTSASVEGESDSDASRTAIVVLELSQSVQPEAAARSLSASVRGPSKDKAPGPAVPLTVTRTSPEEAKRAGVSWDSDSPRRLITVRPRTLWPAGAEIVLKVAPGLVGADGPLPLETPFETSLKTIGPLRLVRHSCTAKRPCSQEAIVLRFNNPIPDAELEEKRARITISPRPSWFNVSGVPSYWHEDDSDEDGAGGDSAGDDSDRRRSYRVELEGSFLPGVTYQVTISPALRDRYQQPLGKPLRLSAVFGKRPFLALSSQRGVLRPGQPQTVGVTSRHLAALTVSAQLLDDPALARLLLAPKPPKPQGAGADGSDEDDGLPAPQPQLVRSLRTSPRGPTDWSSLALDLRELSGGAYGAVLLEVRATELTPRARGERLPPPVRGLFRLTNLGAVLTASRPRSLLGVYRLSDGKPVAGAAAVRLSEAGQPTGPSGRTDDKGLLELAQPLPADHDPLEVRGLYAVSAPAGDGSDRTDRAYLILDGGRAASGDKPDEPAVLRRGERLLLQVLTERDAYRPGETVRAVGFAAIDTPFAKSGLRRVPAGLEVELSVDDPQGRLVSGRRVTTTAEGKFFGELPLPAPGSLGGHTVRARLLDRTDSVRVKVEDYRVPEFAVTAASDPGDVITPARPQIRAAASYFFGGPVALTRARASQRCTPVRYRPPGLPSEWTVDAPLLDGGEHVPSFVVPLPDKASAPGERGRLAFTAPETPPGRDARRCTVSVSLADASHQSIGAETDYLIHPARYYLAVRAPSRLTEGDTLSFAARAVTFDGTRVAADGVRVAIERVYYEPLYKTVGKERVFERTVEHREPAPGCTLRLGSSGADAECRVAATKPGRYELRLSGGPDAPAARTETRVHVQPRLREPPPPPPPPPRTPPASLELTVSSRHAQPGETVDVKVTSPWPLEGTLVLARNGLHRHLPLSLAAAGEVNLRLPVDDTWVPQVTLQVVAVLPPEPPPKPQRAYVQLGRSRRDRPTVLTPTATVFVEPKQRRLQVEVSAPGEARPAATVPIRVTVRDHEARPTSARLALWAVDEAVLSLTGYEVPDLLPLFLPERSAYVSERDDFRSLLDPYQIEPEDSWLSSSYGRGFGSAHGSLGGRSAHAPSVMSGAAVAPQARQRFETTPVFLGDVAVGPSGEATLSARLPDNLTTFRITALASARLVDGESPGRFGLGEARLRVSQPFLVRAALPRMLRPGDVAEIGALLNNLAGPAGQAEVRVTLHQDRPVLRLSTPAATAQRALAAGEQLRLPFTLHAEQSGTAEIELSATLRPSGAQAAPLSDSIRLPLAVESEPTLTERAAVYGTLDDSQAVAVPLTVPAGARPTVGGLEVQASGSLLGDLAGAVQALVDYPYGCLEQTTSRLVPLAALPDLARLLPGVIPDATAYVQVGVQRLASMQVPGRGGFACWPGGREPHLYATAYATWTLHQLRQAGYAVPGELIERALGYLESTIAPPDGEGATPPRLLPGAGLLNGQLDDPLERTRRVMAVHALAELGRKPLGALDELYSRRAALPVFARALLLMALHAALPSDPRVAQLTDELVGHIDELPGTAHVRESVRYRLDALFHSPARSDALVLWALLRVRPEHPAVPKLVRGLIERRGARAWRNTQENAYALLALAAYGKRFEATEPQLHLDAWYGQSRRAPWLGAAELRGRQSPPQALVLPMPRLLEATARGDAGPLLLQRQGSGRLYYRVGLTWAEAGPDLPARTRGLRVARALRTRSVSGAATAPLALAIGEPVAIDLEIENRALLSYVAIDVPLPAGLEALQLNLGRGQASVMLQGTRGAFVSHQEARPDRIVLFADDLPPGTHHHTLYVRPTTPGSFSLPPARAEAMYQPEIYGRSAGALVEVRETK
jgi:hypothetical protein